MNKKIIKELSELNLSDRQDKIQPKKKAKSMIAARFELATFCV